MDSSEELLETAQEQLGVQFRQPDLLQTALTHGSYLQGQDAPVGSSNERLEFLGDAVLGLVVADHLFHQLPDGPEGELTRVRSALVSEPTLARFARQAGLGELLLLEKHQAQAGGRDRASILADAFEAVIGAVFVDRGLHAAGEFVLRWVRPALEELSAGAVETNFKGALQELTQGTAKETPQYTSVEESGPDHDKRFVVHVSLRGRFLGRGVGRTKQAAEQKAAEEAVAVLTEELQREPNDEG